MIEALWIVLALVALAMAALLAYWLITKFIPTMEGHNAPRRRKA
jgi:phage shock protein PspC (stress-responsive transcriptional regulator)